MKKIKILISLFLVFSLLTSCDDDTEKVSRVTQYVTFQLKGEKDLVITQGTAYKELGVIAKEGSTDVSSTVKIKGKVDENTVGLYPIIYEAVNKDGFSASIQRNVIVAPKKLSNIDLSGTYKGGRVGKKNFPVACTITKLAEGVFKADDLFAGYYNLEKEYGDAYKLEAYLYLNTDNTYKAIGVPLSVWSPMEIQNGKYDPATKTLTNKTFFINYDFGFDISLTLNEE